MILGKMKYVHTQNTEQLLNNLLYDVKDKLTPGEIYNIIKQYNNIKFQEDLQKQAKEKQEQQDQEKQEQEFLEKIDKQVNKIMTEILGKLKL